MYSQLLIATSMPKKNLLKTSEFKGLESSNLFEKVVNSMAVKNLDSFLGIKMQGILKIRYLRLVKAITLK
ncbi:MAG: hypothetical protein KC493_09660 [Bacteriovoracaceae bacterium]|nr:hypothetical protein [Bacteriovoracaceae bacterium]